MYGQRIGLDIKGISWFMTSAVIGTVLFQGPIGILSDRFERRTVLTVVTLLTAASTLVFTPARVMDPMMIFIAVAVFGGLAFPLYSVCIAHTNDHLDPSEMIAASDGLVLVGGIGAVFGPILIAATMDWLGEDWFFYSMASSACSPCFE